MLLRRTFLAMLLALTAATSASAQGLVEYALVLVYVEGPGGTLVDEIRMPTALEEDCRASRAIAALCDELADLEGRSLTEVIIRLDAWDGRLEQAVRIDEGVAAKLASPDCAETSKSDDHAKWIPLDGIFHGTHETAGANARTLGRAKLQILDEPTTSCVDRIQQDLEREGVPRGGTLVMAYADHGSAVRTASRMPTVKPTWTDHNEHDVALVYTVAFGDGLTGRLP